MSGLNMLTLQERVRATLTMSESHFREFKSALDGRPGEKTPRDPKLIRRDIGETLVAFANADGGELLVGVEDDGTITGVPHGEAVVESLLNAWRTHVHDKTPLDRPVAVRLELDGRSVLYFSVEKGTSYVHLTQDGRCLQRKDRESVPVASEVVKFERQERLSREYDRGFVDGADATALDEATLAFAGNIIAPGLSPEKVLQLLGLAEYGGAALRLRRAALLLFARDVSLWHPRCEVRILRVSGSELLTGRAYNVIHDKHVVGNVSELLQAAWEELRPYLVETRLGPDGRFQEQVRYPEDACREALTNAIAHRDYTIEGRAIEVFVFDDRLEVQSPGALLSTVTIEGLRTLAGVHQSRNTALARTLRELGYMREMGEGFRRMFQLMKAHDLVEPDVSAGSEQFTVALRHQSVFSEEDQRWISGYSDFLLDRDEEKVLLLGRTGQSLSVQQIMDAVDIVDTEDYRELIERLLNKGLIRGLRATKSTGKQRRNEPRWAVIQPHEATENRRLLMACAHELASKQGHAKHVDLVDTLPDGSPYKRPGNIKKSLAALGLQDLVRLSGPAMRRDEPREPVGEVDELQPTEEPLAVRRRPRLYVGNLAFDATVDDVMGVAVQVGPILEVIVPRDISRPSRNRGYAFVEYERLEDARTALAALAGESVRGRPITTDWSSRSK